MKFIVFTLFFIEFHAILCEDDSVFVKLSNGEIKGRVGVTPKKETTFYAFQQIPYAAPPIGNLRFQPPQSVSDWGGILDTSKNNSKICYQMYDDYGLEDEDCLYLNVYTPRLPIKNGCNSSLPVMFFIHGGGFVGGSGLHAIFGPEFLLDYDVVIVTINYRLGPFGFLHTEDNVIIGNNGLRDQQFALLWVQKNIQHFGGDPDKVTIFGQSAGGASVGYQLLNEKSRGLFRGAIMESGSPISPWAYQRNSRKYAFKTAGYINDTFNSKDNSTELLQFLLNVPASDIDRASKSVSDEEYVNDIQIIQGYFYAPVVEEDKENGFITEKMFETLASGKANRVPIIIGINSEEGISQSTDLDFLTSLMGAYDSHTQLLVPNDMNAAESRKPKIGEEIRNIYCERGEKLADNPMGGIKFLSDTSFSRSVLKHAAIQSFYSTVYAYQFSYDGELGNVTVDIPGFVRGVGHSEENAYLWRSRIGQVYNYDLSIFPKEDLVIQDRLLALWTNFAKYLNPTPKREELLNHTLWPNVSPGGLLSFRYLDIDENLTIKNRPKSVSYTNWQIVYAKYGNRPYDTY